MPDRHGRIVGLEDPAGRDPETGIGQAIEPGLDVSSPPGNIAPPLYGSSGRFAMHTRIRNTRTKLKRIGFRARMKTKNGRKIVNKRRRRHGTFP